MYGKVHGARFIVTCISRKLEPLRKLELPEVPGDVDVQCTSRSRLGPDRRRPNSTSDVTSRTDGRNGLTRHM